MHRGCISRSPVIDATSAVISRLGSDCLRTFCSEAAAVDHELLGGAAAAVVGGEEEDHLRELVGQDPLLDRLIVQRALLPLGRPPLGELAFGGHPAGQHGVDPHVFGPNVRAIVRVMPSTPDLAIA